MNVIAASSPVVDWEALGRVILYSLVAGVGVTFCFSFAIFGATRFAEARRAESGVAAALYALLASVGLAVTVGAVIVGIVIMAKK